MSPRTCSTATSGRSPCIVTLTCCAPEKAIASERDLADFVNGLNAGGVDYAARLSPTLIVDLLEVSGQWVADLIQSLPPHGRSIFPVSWAGEAESENWMDIGREYTERWHHQMQIRVATSRPLTLLEPLWMLPLLDMSVRALPHAYRGIQAPAGTAVAIVVDGETSGAWTLVRREHDWQVISGAASNGASAIVRLGADNVWRMLYNAPYDRAAVRIDGDAALAAPLLKARSVIV